MTRTRTLLRSFAAGELSPELRGRMDEARYAAGARRMRNFLPSPRGPAVKRSGFLHVARTPADATMALLPFRYSGEENLVVGVTAGAFRFFAAGRPVLYCDLHAVAEVDVGANLLRFLDPHRFLDGMQVRVSSFAGSEPAPLSDTAAYTVEVVDAWSIRLQSVTLSGSGSGTLRVARADLWPVNHRPWSPGQLVNATNAATNTFTVPASLDLRTGDAVRLSSSVLLPTPFEAGTYYAIVDTPTSLRFATSYRNALALVAVDMPGVLVEFFGATNQVVWPTSPQPFSAGDRVSFADPTLPPQIAQGVTYYVVNPSTTQFQVAATPGGAAIDFDSAFAYATPVETLVQRHYERGDQVYKPTADKGFYVCIADGPQVDPPNATYWHRLPDDGELEYPNAYSASQLLELDYAQADEALRLTHPDADAGQITRRSATQWYFEPTTFSPPLAAPTGLQATATRGARVRPFAWTKTGGAANLVQFTTYGGHGFANGESVYVENFAAAIPEVTDGFYTIALETAGDPNSEFKLRRLTGEVVSTILPSGGTLLGARTVESSGLRADTENRYVVTALNDDRVESQPSSPVTVQNNLLIPGTRNTLSWNAVDGATRYRVYRELNGLFAVLEETDGTSFVDENLDVKADIRPPTIDATLAGGKPAAVSFWDQRAAYGGFAGDPTKLVLSRAGAASDFSLHVPPRADDRISVRIAFDGSRIRHLLAMRQGLLVLTESAEHLAAPYEGQALTGETITTPNLSRIGAAFPMPVVLNDRAIFAAEDGHLYEVHPSRTDDPTVDLAVRANHLFDGYQPRQLATLQSPWPMVWVARNDGSLLAMSHLPREQALGWSESHVAGGLVESVCGIRDDDGHALYAVVRRGTVRTVERMLPAVYLDDAVALDGTNSSDATVTASGGRSWGPSDSVTLTWSKARPIRVGDFVELEADDGAAARFEITAVDSGFQCRGRPAVSVPAALRDAPTLTWRHGRKRLRSHLASTTLVARLDGGVVETVTTDAQGFADLSTASVAIALGRLYDADLEPLPLVLPQEPGGGFAYTWNLGAAYIGVAGGEFWVGPSADLLRRCTPTGEKERVLLPGQYTADGRVLVRSAVPEPLEVRYLALELTLGGAR